MGRYPLLSHPNGVPSPRFRQRWLVAISVVLLAFAASAAGYRGIMQAAARQRAHFAKQAADEKSARDAWADAAKKVSSIDRSSLQLLARVSSGSLPPQFAARVKTQSPAQIVARNQPALDAVHAALYLPYRPEPDQAINRMNGAYMGTNYRPLAQLLLIEGTVRRSRGDSFGAANSYADLMQMGQTLRRGGPLSALLSASAQDQMGRSALWKLLPSLDAQTARKLARRLEEQGTRDDAWYANALYEERTLGTAALADAFDNPKKLQQLQRNARLSAMIFAMMQSQSGLRGAFNARMFTTANNAAAASPPPTLYNRGMQKWDEWKARQSFDWAMGAYSLDAYQPFQLWRSRTLQAQAATMAFAAQSRAQGGTPRIASSWFPGSQMPQQSPYTAYTSYGSPGIIEFAQSQITETRTGNRLLRVACALAAYRLEHRGRDPNALSDLVPAYLSHIPDDPYAFPVAPLAYKSPAQNALPTNARAAVTARSARGTLYSVGPDGVDDGGVAPQGFIRRVGMGYYYGYGGTLSQSVGSGDLVAGKNAP